MTTTLLTDKEYQGDTDLLPSPNVPMPKKASLYMDFARELYIAQSQTTSAVIRSRRLRDVLTFARPSEATRVGKKGLIEYLAAGEHAIEYDPETLECMGLRVAIGSTNLTPNSEDFNAGSWQRMNVTPLQDQSTAPNGNKKATLLTESTDAAPVTHYLMDNAVAAATVGSPVTFSIFAKAESASAIQLVAMGSVTPAQFANFDLVAGVRTRASALLLQTGIVKHPGGWYRISITITPTVAEKSKFAVVLIDSASAAEAVPAYQGSGKGIYIWGGQIEKFDGVTPYIPTTGATASRAEEVCTTRTDLDFMAMPAGSLFLDYAMPATYQSVSGKYNSGQSLASIDNLTELGYIRWTNRKASDASPNMVMASQKYQGGLASMEIGRLGQVKHGRQAFVCSFTSGDARLFEGINIYASALPMDAKFNRIMIGRAFGDQNTISNACIRKLIYYPTTLSNEQLVSEFNALA